jgi:hypothetical protein
LPERIVRFYHFVAGIRVDIERLSAGEFDHDLPRKAYLVREDLDLWNEAVGLGRDLVRELREVAGRTFLGPSP